MIETIITDYLRQNRRLVIPELGAFLKKEEGETVFVPFLNKDDGVLAGLIRQSYGTSTAEAGGIIVQYAENVRQGISRSGGYRVASLGSLKRDANEMLYLDTGEQTVGPVTETVAEKPDAFMETPVDESVANTPDVKAEAFAEEVPAYTPLIVPSKEQTKVAENETITTKEPVASAKTVGESIDAPKTLNDLIRERQEQIKAPETLHQRMSEAPKPPQRTVRKAAVHPARHPQSASDVPSKRGDWILIGAIVVAILAVIALIYSYTAINLPTFNLQ